MFPWSIHLLEKAQLTSTTSAWRWPAVEGLHSFKGKLMHTARYDTGYSLAGKRVAVIGAGSSGIQLVANIQKEVEQLFCWVRSPTWVTAGFAQRFAGPDGQNFACMYTVIHLLFRDRYYLADKPQTPKSKKRNFEKIL